MSTFAFKQAVISPQLMTARLVSNEDICREHKRLVLAVKHLSQARPGQFLHLGRMGPESARSGRPYLRRAFSIGGIRRGATLDEVVILFRIVGAGTQWMAGLRPGDAVSALGPLGNGFELADAKPVAWLVAGGVGLPPLIWWAEWLHRAGKTSVAFCGARSRDLVPLTIIDPAALDRDALRPAHAAKEFSQSQIPIIVSTDDGSLGFHGTVGAALAAYHDHWRGDPADVVVYCCGPERMMAATARWCLANRIDCQLCTEREMACGTGTCQSCVVAVRDPGAADGWRYALCCSEGPVFSAGDVIWA